MNKEMTKSTAAITAVFSATITTTITATITTATVVFFFWRFLLRLCFSLTREKIS